MDKKNRYLFASVMKYLKIPLYLAPSILPSTLTSFLIPTEEKPPQQNVTTTMLYCSGLKIAVQKYS